MGFNDPLGAEHYLIIARHFRLTQFLTVERGYEWLLLAMHGTGRGCSFPRIVFAQDHSLVLCGAAGSFPSGGGLLLGPTAAAHQPSTAPQDREGFTDVPFILGMGFVAHSIWILVSLGVVVDAARTPFGSTIADHSRVGSAIRGPGTHRMSPPSTFIALRLATLKSREG